MSIWAPFNQLKSAYRVQDMKSGYCAWTSTTRGGVMVFSKALTNNTVLERRTGGVTWSGEYCTYNSSESSTCFRETSSFSSRHNKYQPALCSYAIWWDIVGLLVSKGLCTSGEPGNSDSVIIFRLVPSPRPDRHWRTRAAAASPATWSVTQHWPSTGNGVSQSSGRLFLTLISVRSSVFAIGRLPKAISR